MAGVRPRTVHAVVARYLDLTREIEKLRRDHARIIEDGSQFSIDVIFRELQRREKELEEFLEREISFDNMKFGRL